MKQELERLPDAELDVMKILWQANEPLGTSKILELVNEEKSWSMSTLQTLLARLTERGFVQIHRKKRFNYYSPIVDEQSYCIGEAENFIGRHFNGSFENLVTALVDAKAIKTGDLEKIANMLRESEEEDDG